jgi:hypothetical protein
MPVIVLVALPAGHTGLPALYNGGGISAQRQDLRSVLSDNLRLINRIPTRSLVAIAVIGYCVWGDRRLKIRQDL